ncbi:MAG: hypothetical protein CVU89_14830 [Firmicutes bacterium HGW-Firmicutes-14]|nr:MAG: hypothetical protein CVU89_14830 [Firmicutes bacterium HGW-Firmicutes-14]
MRFSKREVIVFTPTAISIYFFFFNIIFLCLVFGTVKTRGDTPQLWTSTEFLAVLSCRIKKRGQRIFPPALKRSGPVPYLIVT